LQTVGYSEVFEHLDGKMSLEAAIEEIKKNTRQYAKRQMTWFKKDKKISGSMQNNEARSLDGTKIGSG
jgi:tRNA dimethylallyltransferase